MIFPLQSPVFQMQPSPARSFNANCQLVTVVTVITVVRPNNSRQLSWVRRFIFIFVTVGSNFIYSFISPFLFRHPSNTQFTNIQDSFKGYPGRDNLQEHTWDEKMILKKQNPPSLSSSFLGWNRCQESPHKFSKSGHCRILRKLHFSILKKRIFKRLVKIDFFRK